jgi:hypothetical protein
MKLAVVTGDGGWTTVINSNWEVEGVALSAE